MSLPSITETRNATLLRIRIVILAAHYTATSSPSAFPDLRLVAATLSRPQGQRHLIFSRVRCHGTRIL